ncbi:MAG: hypothetical protein E7369_00365 [Clostridiales bacterium]|nr:hypothetical protein [Clostridiales bacterium]
MRKIISLTFKILVVTCSILAFVLSIFSTRLDGYSHWTDRFFYFTWQSNLWLALSFIAVLMCGLFKGKNHLAIKRGLYVVKYITTVCITITFLVFITLLAPFAPAEYRLFSFSSILSHLVVPFLAIADFFLDDFKFTLTKSEAFLTVIPPGIYTIVVWVLSFLNVDFGRGDPFPYYFMNVHSPAGMFGFSAIPPYFVGTFYWVILLASMVFGVGILYVRLKSGREERKKSKNKGF